MITDEKKKRIESLTDSEMEHEINLGRRSRFQREAFAYLQTCYQQRKNEKEEHDAMMRSFHGVPLASELENMPEIDLAELQSKLPPDSPGKIIIGNEWQQRKNKPATQEVEIESKSYARMTWYLLRHNQTSRTTMLTLLPRQLNRS